jgi:putative NADPH-quinone reductase
MRLLYRNALVWQLRHQVLGFVGIRPVRLGWFAAASHARPATVQRWLAQARAWGARAS